MKVQRNDVMIGRELNKLMPNDEAIYTEYWKSGAVIDNVLKSWFFDGDPEVMCFGEDIIKGIKEAEQDAVGFDDYARQEGGR
jgi:hypothetical protein